MATAKPVDIVNGLKPYMGTKALSDEFRITLLNQANDHFSAYADWRWLTRAAPEITLVNDGQTPAKGRQTYNWLPADNWPVAKVVFAYGVREQGQISSLHPLSSVPETNLGVSDFPTAFEFLPTLTGQPPRTANIRLWPRPPAAASGRIIPIEKRQQTRVTPANLDQPNILEHPDHYHHIYQLFLLDLMLLYAQVGQQSGITMAPGAKNSISGPLARAYQAAGQISRTEALFVDPTTKGPLGLPDA